MGCFGSRQRQPRQINQPPLTQQTFVVACVKAYEFINNDANKLLATTSQEERQLIQMIYQQNRSLDRERDKASTIVSNLQMIDAIEIIKRCCTILRERSLQFCNSGGNQQQLGDLMICVESIVWTGNRIDQVNLQRLQAILENFFSSNGQPLQINENNNRVNPNLKNCFRNVLPNTDQINNYLRRLSQKEGIHIDYFNRIGHGI